MSVGSVSISPAALSSKFSAEQTWQPVVTLDYLPDEILLLIVGELEPHDFPTFHALCLVNHHFYRIAAPSLWEEYGFESGRKHVHHSFLGALINSQMLCEWVKSVYCDQKATVCAPFTNFSRVSQKIYALDVALPHLWIDSLVAGQRDAFLALVFCLAPNIDEIDLDFEVTIDDVDDHLVFSGCLQPIILAALGVPFGNVHQFQYLKTITLNVTSAALSSISPLFKLPSLRQLVLNDSDRSIGSWHRNHNLAAENISSWRCPPWESAITTLMVSGPVPADLLYSMWKQRVLNPPERTWADFANPAMIQSIAALQRFHFYGDVYLIDNPNWFRPVGSILSKHEATLEYLSFHRTRYPNPSEGTAIVKCSPLQLDGGFPKITTFGAPLFALVETDAYQMPNQLAIVSSDLPPSVQSLQLELPPHWDPRTLVDLQQPWNYALFPNLRSLHIHYNCVDSATPPTVLLALQKYFSKTGINFSFLVDYFYMNTVLDQQQYEDMVSNFRHIGPEAAEMVKHMTFGQDCE